MNMNYPNQRMMSGNHVIPNAQLNGNRGVSRGGNRMPAHLQNQQTLMNNQNMYGSARLLAHSQHSMTNRMAMHQNYQPNPLRSHLAPMSEGPRFDASDFPALGGAAGDSNDASSKPQAPGRAQHFGIHPEEFPALGGSTQTDTQGMQPRQAFLNRQPNPQHLQHPQHMQPQLRRPSDSTSSGQDLSSQPQLGPGQQRQHHNSHPSNFQGQRPSHLSQVQHAQMQSTQQPMGDNKQHSGPSNQNRWGLTGLLGVMRMSDPDLTKLALGTDLSTLGLNFSSDDVLHASFAYPCRDTPTKRVPDYVLPYCYYSQVAVDPPALKTSHLKQFNVETLFYTFYNMPRDAVQLLAARELHRRDWRYQKDTQLWFRRANTSQQQQSYEFFDVNMWELKFTTDQPSGKFMTLQELTGTAP